MNITIISGTNRKGSCPSCRKTQNMYDDLGLLRCCWPDGATGRYLYTNRLQRKTRSFQPFQRVFCRRKVYSLWFRNTMDLSLYSKVFYRYVETSQFWKPPWPMLAYLQAMGCLRSVEHLQGNGISKCLSIQGECLLIISTMLDWETSTQTDERTRYRRVIAAAVSKFSSVLHSTVDSSLLIGGLDGALFLKSSNAFGWISTLMKKRYWYLRNNIYCTGENDDTSAICYIFGLWS